MAGESPIFVKCKVFMIWMMQHTANFPRNERFRLAKHIDDALFAFYICLLRAVEGNAQTHLKEANFCLNQIRFYLQIAVELHYTTSKQYLFASAYTVELGRLIGGWLKKA